MTSGGRRRVLLEKRALIGLSLSHLILACERRDGVRAVEGRKRGREPRAARSRASRRSREFTVVGSCN